MSMADQAMTGPRMVLEKRPELAALVGQVAIEWSLLEEQLLVTFRFGIFFGSKPNTEAMALAKDALDAARSQHAQFEMIRRVLKRRLATEVFAKWEPIEDDLRKRARERNRIVHGNWSVIDSKPDQIFLSQDEKLVGYGKKDFEQVLDRIDASINGLATFMLLNART